MSSDVAELERAIKALPDGWASVCVADALAKKRGETVAKLQTSDYLDQGALPIVDQGAKFICGYTDDLTAEYPYSLPVTVFGDHTRTLKYVDFPFAVGADGTQCLHPTADFDDRFFFYSLQNIDLRSEGYARHFKLLKERSIARPPLNEQRRIAEVLRSVDDAIAANRAALDQVARARSAMLHAAFEETLWEPVSLGELGSWQSGGTPSKDDDAKWGGDIPWVCPRDMKTPVIRQTHSTLTPLALGGSCKLAPRGTLMIVVRGMILAKAIPTATTAMDATFNQDMKAFRPNGRAMPKFVQLCLQHQERQLLRVVNTATHGTKKLDTDTLLAVSVPLPDLETQEALADAVSDMDFASVKCGEEHIRLSTIKRALMSDLLSGRVRVPA